MTTRWLQQWGKLIDDQLDLIAGQRDLLPGRVQEAVGIARDQTERRFAAAAAPGQAMRYEPVGRSAMCATEQS